MTLHRRPEIPFTDAAQGDCRWCGETILHVDGKRRGEVNRRRRWHPECVELYNATDPREARRRIRKRDRGVCAECRLDTYKLRRELRKIGRGMTRELRKRGFKPRKSLWELEHSKPLIDAGTHSDDHLQTLCTPCHTRKTAMEARERAQRNKREKRPTVGPTSAARKSDKDSSRETAALDAILDRAAAINARVAKLLAGGRLPDRTPR